MQVKLLHDLVEEMAGIGAGRIVEILFRKKDVNEFLIARKMDLTINQVRNILYKLSAEGLVSFTRKKDKRKGWYIYYWTLKTEKCLMKLEKCLMLKIDGLNNVLGNREMKRFYVCKSCNIEVNEEKALDHGFSCEECAEVYELSDNSKPIRDTKTMITKTEKDLKLIRDELEEIRGKEKKKRFRADKKVAKEEAKRKVLIKVAKAEARRRITKSNLRSIGVRGTGVLKRRGREKERKKGKKVMKKVKKKIIKKARKKVMKKKIRFVGKLKKKILRKKK